MKDAQKFHGVQRRRQPLCRCRKRPSLDLRTVPLDRPDVVSERCIVRISRQVSVVYKRDACVQRIGVNGARLRDGFSKVRSKVRRETSTRRGNSPFDCVYHDSASGESLGDQ